MNYTKDDKQCNHCGGAISGHCCGDFIIFWCNECGSNDPTTQPKVSYAFSKEPIN